MNSILRRRRALMMAGEGESWDYEWDFTMGKLENQDGVSVSVNGTASSTLSNDGEVFTTGTYTKTANNYYIQPYFLQEDARRYMTDGFGVLECVLKAHLNPTSSTYASQQNFRITIAESATKRLTICQTIQSGKWIILDDSNTKDMCTRLADYTNDTWYKVRLEMHGTFARFFLNDELVADNISLSTTLFGSANGIMAQNMNNGTCTLKSLKLKIGRL